MKYIGNFKDWLKPEWVDVTKVAETVGYSTSHVSNTISGTRRINNTIANAMYSLTRRRIKNSELA